MIFMMIYPALFELLYEDNFFPINIWIFSRFLNFFCGAFKFNLLGLREFLRWWKDVFITSWQKVKDEHQRNLNHDFTLFATGDHIVGADIAEYDN